MPELRNSGVNVLGRNANKWLGLMAAGAAITVVSALLIRKEGDVLPKEDLASASDGTGARVPHTDYSPKREVDIVKVEGPQRTVVDNSEYDALVNDAAITHIGKVYERMSTPAAQFKYLKRTIVGSDKFIKKYGDGASRISPESLIKLKAEVWGMDIKIRDAKVAAEFEKYSTAEKYIRNGKFEEQNRDQSVDIQGRLNTFPGSTVMILPGATDDQCRVIVMKPDECPKYFSIKEAVSQLQFQRDVTIRQWLAK